MKFGVRRGSTLWLATGVLALAAIGVTGFAYAGRSRPVAVATTVRAQRGAVTLTSSAAGTVTPVGTRGLSFSTAGVVTEIDVKPGDTVQAGQVLARMDASSVQNDVDAAQASVNSAGDALARAQQTQSPTPAAACQNTARVAPAAYLEVPTPSPSAQPSASGSPSPSSSPSTSPSRPVGQPSGGHSTQPGGTRPGGGHSGGAGPGDGQGTGQQGGHASGGCTGTANGAGGGRFPAGDSLMAAEQQLTNATLALHLAQAKLAGTTIIAPVNGKVLSVAGTVGAQQTPASTGFIVLGAVTDTAVRAQFSEADVAHLAVGQTAMITLPNQDGKQVPGKVSQIEPAGTASGRLVRYGVLVAFDAVPPDLLLGQSANVAVVTASATDVVFVPSTAVTGVADGTGNVTIHAAGRDERRTVQVGLRGDQYTEIRSGMQAGEELVIPTP
jgi:multidrug efflux pump subunit AcrA (membrane-fusion protein)